jgi:hypothetical protein
MSLRRSLVEVPARVVIVVSLLALTAAAQEKKEFTYNVGPQAVVSITNNYGPITVKPSGSRQVVVETVSHSDAVSLMNEQHGDRIELRSVSSRQGADLVDYTVLVPADAFVSLRSSDGTLRAQGLRGDVILEAAAASVEVTDISDAHLHVKTLSGPITLTDIRNSHLDIHSVSGNADLAPERAQLKRGFRSRQPGIHPLMVPNPERVRQPECGSDRPGRRQSDRPHGPALADQDF